MTSSQEKRNPFAKNDAVIVRCPAYKEMNEVLPEHVRGKTQIVVKCYRCGQVLVLVVQSRIYNGRRKRGLTILLFAVRFFSLNLKDVRPVFIQ